MGLQTDELQTRAIYPTGTFLPVLVERVWELVEHFQFLTMAHLRSLALAHGLSFTSRFRRDGLVNLLRLHRQCGCMRTIWTFRQIGRPRQNVQVVHLTDPTPSQDFVQSIRQQRAHGQRNIHSERSQLQANKPSHFPHVKSFEEKKEIILEWQDRLRPSL